MLPQQLYEDLKKLLAQRFNQPINNIQLQSVGGGSINKTYKLTFSNTHAFFCKINHAVTFPELFLKEAQGLKAIQQTGAIKTPEVIACTTINDQQILLLEWIESGQKTPAFFKRFGEQLARLHHHTSENFGWTDDNYMGSVPQQNSFQKNWNDFFIHQRLEPLAQKSVANNLLSQTEHGLFKKLYQKLPQFFAAAEKPSLIHGDLWSGNFMCTQNGEPVLIDPAVYYGHRSMDLAMTMLFGGFDAAFYESYQYHFPLPSNYKEQLPLCNLYPLLIHLLLFGRPYLTPIQQTLRNFL